MKHDGYLAQDSEPKARTPAINSLPTNVEVERTG